MERSANTQVDQLRGAGAPRAPMPGRGVGNVPFSPGMASGQLGPQASAPQTPPTPPMPGGSPGSPPPSASPSGPGQGPPPLVPGMGGGNPMLDPSYYFEVMASLMQAYTRTAANPGLPWGY